jgi:hypothetical protein
MCRSYMFRYNWTILRERMLSLTKATILWNWSVKIHRYMICGVVARSISGCDVCTACRVVWWKESWCYQNERYNNKKKYSFSYLACVAHTRARKWLFTEPSLGRFPDHLPTHKTNVLNFLLWSKVQVLVFLGIRGTRAATNPQLSWPKSSSR